MKKKIKAIGKPAKGKTTAIKLTGDVTHIDIGPTNNKTTHVFEGYRRREHLYKVKV